MLFKPITSTGKVRSVIHFSSCSLISVRYLKTTQEDFVTDGSTASTAEILAIRVNTIIQRTDVRGLGPSMGCVGSGWVQ